MTLDAATRAYHLWIWSQSDAHEAALVRRNIWFDAVPG
jgi:hypothetical protein